MQTTEPSQNLAQDQEVSRRIVLPDGRYFLRVLKRQFPFMVILLLVMGTFGTIATLRQKNLYQSWVTVTYDPRDSSEQFIRYPNYPRFYQIEASFKGRFTSTEFLYELAQRMNWTNQENKESTGIKQKIMNSVKSWMSSNSHQVPPEDSKLNYTEMENLANVLKSMIEVGTEERSQLLSLKTVAEKPEDAQKLAKEAMELFMQSELQYESNRAALMQESFQSFLLDENLKAGEGKSSSSSKPETSESVPQSSEAASLKEQEADLLSELQSLKAELLGVSGQRSQRRAAIESELARLTTRFQSSHPEVIAKREELRLFDQGDETSPIQAKINQTRGKLQEVRKKLRDLGVAVNLSEGISLKEENIKGQFLPYVADKVGELNLERANILRQIGSPALRTRFGMLLPASYESKPSVNNRKKTALGFVTLTIVALIMLTVIREFQGKYARDSWRISNRIFAPALAEVSGKTLKEYPVLSPEIMDGLKKEVGSKKGDRSTAATILGQYRDLSNKVRNQFRGDFVVFLNVGSEVTSAGYIHNFMNLWCHDQGGGQLLIDCDAVDPVPFTGGEPKVASKTDVASYLLKQAAWNDVRFGKTAERLYDLVPPPFEYDGQLAKAFRPDVWEKLYQALGKSYKKVFIRGMHQGHVTENEAIVRYASDVVLMIDAKTSTYGEIDQMVKNLPPNKLSGYVLLQT